MEEDPLAKERKAQQKLAAQRDTASASHGNSSAQDDLEGLFGELWPLPMQVGSIVKLNPEVGREKMGQQLKYLKRRIHDERVWQFEPKAQHWLRLRVDEEAS
jgi:hypothetical protein